MATRTVTIHDRCITEGCGKTLHSIAEGERGTCASCWVKTMPADTRKAMNRLIAAAFRPTTDAEKDAVVDVGSTYIRSASDVPDRPMLNGSLDKGLPAWFSPVTMQRWAKVEFEAAPGEKAEAKVGE